MERKEYLEWCRDCAVLPRLRDTQPSVPDRLKVTADGKPYYPYGYELRFDEHGQVIHTAILHDLKANSVVYAELKRVKKYISEVKNNDKL